MAILSSHKILRGTLPSWKKSRGEINIFSVPIQRSLIFTPLYNFFIKNIVQGFLMYDEFAPKHFILKLFLLQQQILCFYSFYQYEHWNLYIPFDFYISTFCLGLPQNPSIPFTTHVPMQKLIIPTL